jgi:ATP-dependent Lon protease
MEVIDISGYLLEEKIEIAKRHLIPKQQKEHGLKKTQVSFADKIIEKIIEEYTRESGVRYLEKLIARMIRSNARFIVQGEKYNSKFNEKDLLRVLGPEPYQKEKDMQIMIPGIATGLAWTPVGGEILFIESSLSKGKGVLTLTGNLGDVMKESAAIAFEYLKSHADILNITEEQLGEKNVHIHVPEGATPKDGPSAGITMFTALVSAFTGRKVKSLLAMTGEITLRGKVLPVGGIKEKILAARRAKVKDIILSNENKKDILEIKEDYLTGITFHYVNNMLEVIDLALEKAKPAKSK